MLHALGFRVIEHLVRRSLLLNHALMQKQDLARHIPRKRHLVGDHDHGSAFLGQTLHNLDWFEVREVRGTINTWKVGSYQVKLGIGFSFMYSTDLYRECGLPI